MKVDLLLEQIKEHTENWMRQCNYNIPYDYEGLSYILIKCRCDKCEEAIQG